MRIIVINFQSLTNRFFFKFEDFRITWEEVPINQVIPISAIRCSHEEIIRHVNKIRIQIISKEKRQRLAVAVELKVGIVACHCDPRLQINAGEKVAAFMNPYQLSVFCAVKVQSIIYHLGTFFHADLQSGDNNLHVVLPILKCCIVLYFRRCSKTAENCFLTILNLTLAVIINDHGRLTEPCAWAGATSGQVKDQGVLAKFGVAFGEVQHGGWVADELIMGQDRPIILPQCASAQIVT